MQTDLLHAQSLRWKTPAGGLDECAASSVRPISGINATGALTRAPRCEMMRLEMKAVGNWGKASLGLLLALCFTAASHAATAESSSAAEPSYSSGVADVVKMLDAKVDPG